MKAPLILTALLLAGCATNPGLDKRISCTRDGRAIYTVTYGPLALVEPMKDADSLCAVKP